MIQMFQVHITFGGRQAQPTKMINLRDIDDDMQVTDQIIKTKAQKSTSFATFCPEHHGTNVSFQTQFIHTATSFFEFRRLLKERES